jgi:hypothetical protein
MQNLASLPLFFHGAVAVTYVGNCRQAKLRAVPTAILFLAFNLFFPSYHASRP